MRASSTRTALALVLVGLILSGCQLDVKLERLPRESPIAVHVSANGDAPAGQPVDYAVLIEGRRVYDERCSPCHGETGYGDGPLADVLPVRPRNYHEEPFKWGAKPSKIIETITRGRSGVMPSFADTLNAREMWAAAYVVWYWVPEERRENDTAEDLVRN